MMIVMVAGGGGAISRIAFPFSNIIQLLKEKTKAMETV
jgi:hypothetical protein